MKENLENNNFNKVKDAVQDIGNFILAIHINMMSMQEDGELLEFSKKYQFPEYVNYLSERFPSVSQQDIDKYYPKYKEKFLHIKDRLASSNITLLEMKELIKDFTQYVHK